MTKTLDEIDQSVEEAERLIEELAHKHPESFDDIDKAVVRLQEAQDELKQRLLSIKRPSTRKRYTADLEYIEKLTTRLKKERELASLYPKGQTWR